MYRKRSPREFEKTMLPHIDAAYRLAMWLLGHSPDAEDAVQDSFVRAFRAFDGWKGVNAKGWLLKIVRNTCMTQLGKRSRNANVIHLDTVSGDHDGIGFSDACVDKMPLAEDVLIAADRQARLWAAVNSLPTDSIIVLILREFEDQSYKQISEIVGIPIGTVMSRLSRARQQLRARFLAQGKEGKNHEM